MTLIPNKNTKFDVVNQYLIYAVAISKGRKLAAVATVRWQTNHPARLRPRSATTPCPGASGKYACIPDFTPT